MKKNGFSIIELVVCVSILGTAIILIIGLFSQMLNVSQKSVDMTAGTVIAESLMSQESEQILTDANIKTIFSTVYAAPYTVQGGNYSLNNSDFYYKIYLQDVAFGGMPLLQSSVTGNAAVNLKRMDTVVWWYNAAGPQGRVGMGTLWVDMSRLIWPTTP